MGVVLFIAYFFPPLGGSGVQRSAKFVKYLPQHGWRPVVLSARLSRRNRIDQGLDPGLLADLPPDIEVERTHHVDLSLAYAVCHRLHLRRPLLAVERMIPLLNENYRIGWLLPGLRRATRLVQERSVQVVYSTSTPFSSHAIAAGLKRRFGVPWVADFRDPMVQRWTAYSPPTPVHARLERALERAIVTRADVVIANTDRNRAEILERHALRPEAVRVIPNGFDSADFPRVTSGQQAPGRFVVAAVGNFYGMSDPTVFFRAYRTFHAAHPDALLRLVGWRPSRGLREIVGTLLPPGSWEESGRTDHAGAVLAMCDASLLVVNLPNERSEHWVPGKLYEYLRAERPILLIGPVGGDAATILRRTRTGDAVGFDEQAIEAVLERRHAARSDGRSWDPDRQAIGRYDRNRQAGELAEIFATLSRGRVRGAA